MLTAEAGSAWFTALWAGLFKLVTPNIRFRRREAYLTIAFSPHEHFVSHIVEQEYDIPSPRITHPLGK